MIEGGSAMDGEAAVEIDAGGGGMDRDGGGGITLDERGVIDVEAGGWIEGDSSGNGSNETVPFMTVFKGDNIVESFCLVGQDLFVMGRCSCSADMLVSHATCSRQHLEIQIIHATREIILTDLESAHGTWLDGGKRLPTMTPTIMKDTATFQLGTSKRVYRIDWQPAPDVSVHPSSSDLSTTSAETGAEATREPSPPSEAPSVLSGRRYAANNEDFLPSAPYAPSADSFIFPDESTARPGAGAFRRSVKRSPPTSGGELRKSMSSPKILFTQDENVSPVVRYSPAVKPGQLTRSASSPSKPNRRLAFSALQPSAVNAQSPRSSPALKKPLAERSNSSGSLQPPPHSVSPKVLPFNKQPRATPPKVQDVNLTSTPSKLWLRRCHSSPLPALATGTNVPTRPQARRLAALNEHSEAKDGTSDQPLEGVPSPAVSDSKMSESADDEFSSGKENVDPRATRRRKERAADQQGSGLTSLTSRGSTEKGAEREPFRPLQHTSEARPTFFEVPQASETIAWSASSDVSSKVVGGVLRPLKHRASSVGMSKSRTSSGYGSSAPALLPRSHQRMSSVSSLDLLSPSEQLQRKLRLGDHPTEVRRQWHIVVDTNCLLDAESLKALKQLEGIREVDVIIPKIVVRELDCLKHRHGGRSNVRAALKWIQSCMVRLPSWIHVQSNLETRPVKATPPVSPVAGAFTQYSDLMSPTNEDHVLECALIFAALKAHYGKVALLTGDVALQIKAMAEGLVSETAPEFCESLLSPYSSRFLWVGSTAHGKTWADHYVPTANSVNSSLRGKARASNKSTQHLVEDLRHHVNTQPKGLQLVAELK